MVRCTRLKLGEKEQQFAVLWEHIDEEGAANALFQAYTLILGDDTALPPLGHFDKEPQKRNHEPTVDRKKS